MGQGLVMQKFFQQAQNVEQEAAAWLARLRADDRSAQDEHAFHAWLAASPRNAAAFEDLSSLWDVTGALSPELRAAKPKARFDRRLLLGGLGTLLASGGGFALMGAQASVYETDVGEQKHVALKDGTGVFLDTETKLVVDFSDAARQVDLRYGRANFRVAPDPLRPFLVKAAQKLVVGTRSDFDVRRDGERVSVVLIRGTASVKSITDEVKPSHTLGAGERLVALSARTVTLDKPNLRPLLAWQTGQAIFENESLSSAVEEMNRYSDIKITVGDPRIAGLKVSGVYGVGDNMTFAVSLSRLLAVDVHRVDNQITLVGSNTHENHV
jgi:transmembrane sensor